MKRLLLVISMTLTAYSINAQNFNNIVVDESSNGLIFLDFLRDIESRYNIDFLCDERKMNALTVNGIAGRQKLKDYLDYYLRSYSIIKAQDDVIFIVDKALADKYDWKKDNYLVLKRKGSGTITFQGTVMNGKTGDPLIGARVYFPELKRGDASDLDGNFLINDIPQEALTLDVQYVGYEAEAYLVGFSELGTDKSHSFTLFPESRELETVTITAQRLDHNVVANLTGVESMSIAKIKAIPTFMGEVDPIRSITTLPGVSTVGELASGFNVRGGDTGQNLILQDGAPIYNPSHLFGFFSSFNPDLVNNVTLYKGGGPSNFGGRISSVLDISLKNGDVSKHSVSGGIGFVSSRLAAEGPIIGGRLSYAVGARISYTNWLVHATDNIQLKNSSAKFNDITAKIFYKPNDNNIVTLSFYQGYDDFKLATDSIFSWGTTNASLKWDHTFNEKIFGALNIYRSSYFSEVESISPIDGFTYRNSIDNVGLKYELSYSFGNQKKIMAGIESVGTWLEPGKLVPVSDAENIQPENLNNQNAVESAAFVQLDYDFSPKWSVAAGLRYSYFVRLGEDGIYVYDFNTIKGRYPVIVDTINYKSGDVIKRYGGFEPRLSLRYLINKNTSLKLGYYRGYQYLHLISNTTSTTPQDYWVTSGPYLKPQIGDQFSLGYFQNLKEDSYEISLEGFYKDIANAVDYIEGADITLNPALEAGLLQGTGVAYGLEVFAKKNSGRLNGSIGYTYSRSLRKYEEGTARSTINNGEYYPSAFDQPNRINVLASYKLTPRIVASANFNYATGRPITIPISKFSYDGYLAVMNYSERNEYRIPDYHRLDLSLTIKENPASRHRIKSEWMFSIFNVYSRDNAYSITFNRYGTATKLSILGSMFPSITYSFRI
jgi:hypothetical protein